MKSSQRILALQYSTFCLLINLKRCVHKQICGEFRQSRATLDKTILGFPIVFYICLFRLVI